MGVLRVLLALAVVRAHTIFFENFLLVQAGLAVIAFYIISGFYMAMVITEKYSRQGAGWERNFLTNRAIRLFPCYWAVMLITLATYAYLGKANIFTSDLGLTLTERAIAIFSNIFLVGMDVIVSGAVLKWHGATGGLAVSWEQFPVIVGWTVAVELTFYFFAAYFIFTSKRTILFAFAIAIYIRLYFLLINGKFLGFSKDGIGFSNTPWGYHFFGIALIYFMFGYLSYRLYVYLRAKAAADPNYKKKVKMWTIGLVLLTVFATYKAKSFLPIADYNDYRLWLAMPLFILLIPNLFLLTKDSAMDNFIGLFSYPIYLCHEVASEIGAIFVPDPAYTREATLVAVLVISTLLVLLIERPLEGVRKRRSKTLPQQATIHTPHPA